jgi:hypothetical protein
MGGEPARNVFAVPNQQLLACLEAVCHFLRKRFGTLPALHSVSPLTSLLPCSPISIATHKTTYFSQQVKDSLCLASIETTTA